MNAELEELREWKMEASRVLSNIYDAFYEPDHEVEGCTNLGFEVEQNIADIKLLLEKAPLHYRRLV